MKDFLYSLPELLPTYAGGQIEIQGKAKDGVLPSYIYRGEIKNIGLRDISVVIEMSWVAEMTVGTGKWKFAKTKPYEMDLRLYSVSNIGPGREGSDRLCFSSVEELVVLFPPDGSVLHKEKIQE